MNLLCITDLHGSQTALEAILAEAGPVDVILLGGDLTNFGTPNVAEEIVAAARSANPRVLAVAGNCDSPAIDERLAQLGVSLFGRGVIEGDAGFYGVSAMPPWMGTMYELSEEQIAAALEAGRRDVQGTPRAVVVSHPPPRDTKVDKTRGGDHVGSTSLREFVERTAPDLLVCGHIHEARGLDRIGPTTVVNCGPGFRGDYAVAHLENSGVRVDLRTADGV